MKPFNRSQRVGGLLHRQLAEILQKKIKDPRLQTIQITQVNMSPDLKNAKIYYTVPKGTKLKDVQTAFDKAGGYIKRILAGLLELRYMPAIKYYFDDTLEYGMYIDELLSSIKNEDNYSNPEE